ncbi:pre-peptidase C-terminal domain-containing protein [Aliikangiella coralliicola]|uniref:Glycosyl hydrolase n=1 Tax=Aliikangiella coralliicola TaxID=2592383 RepID=A0A545UJY3_9GAMM|nr:pre-peptidase C-terminal domain-containing protein [Aliikangiella coralliicola]TQV89766.1 hypothetical protein FLL46_02480 [Aliikangiella coralliicola]
MNQSSSEILSLSRRKKIFKILIAALVTLGIFFVIQPQNENTSSKAIKLVGPEKPGMHQALMRMSGGNYTPEAVKQARQQHRQQVAIQSRSLLRNPMNVPQWQLRGPTNFMGRVTAVVADPQNPNKVYVGAALGGVWKSTNGGSNFSQVFDGAGSPSIGALALDPTNSDIIYVGTGEANPGGGSVTHLGDGLWKSSDGGQTWQQLGLENSTRIGSIVINPNNTSEIFVAAVGSLFVSSSENRGVFRSQDGGQTWTKVLAGRNGFTGAIDVKMDPSNPERLYAVLWEHYRAPNTRDYGGLGSGIWKSTDGGDNWSQLNNGLPSTNNQYGRIAIGVAPSDPSRLYASYSNDDGTFRSFHRSDNYGQSWTTTSGSYNCSTYCWWFGVLTVSPTNKDHVFANSIQLHRSTNGGNSFGSYNKGFHVDHQAMWISPNGNTIYEGNDGGIYRSTNSGSTYTHLPLPISQFYAIEVDPTNHSKLLGGLQDNGSGYTTNGSSWNNLNGGDGFTVLVDNQDSNCIYSESQYGNIYTTCGGSVNISGRKPWHTQMMFDESNNRYVYYGSQYLYRTYRTGNSISSPEKVSPIDFSNGPHSGSFNGSYGTISSIHVPISGNGNIIYLGTDDGNVWVSTNRGSNWTQIDTGLPERWVTRVTADPQNDAIAYVSFSGFRNGESAANLYRTDNYGQSWTNISGNLPNSPVSDILVDPTYSSTLYAANDYAVYVSYDTGSTWQVLGTGLPVVLHADLKLVVDGADIVLHSGTYGRAIYSVRLNDEQRGGDGTTPPDVIELVNGQETAVPNLATREAKMFKLEVPAEATDVVFEITGNNGDADLYVRFGEQPTNEVNDCKSTSSNSNESCSLSAQAGTYYARVYAYAGFTNLKITATYTTGNSGDTELVKDVTQNVPNLAKNDSTYYQFTVPEGVSNVKVSTNGSNGDLDLYVKKGARPDNNDYDCRSISSNSIESCSPGDTAGVYYVKVFAYSAFTNATIVMTYNEGGNDNELVNHQWKSVPASPRNALLEYFYDVSAGTSSLSFSTQGVSGDADLYVKFGSVADTNNYDCKSTSSNSSETCTINNIQAGRYHVTVHAWNSISGTEVKADSN